MQIELMPVRDVTPYARNPRINDQAVAKVASSIKEYGWRQPIVVDEDKVIIAGHTRWLAAQKLKMDEVPVHIANGLTPQQVKAYRLADNRVSEDASWDTNLLKLELQELEVDFDLTLTGFDGTELAALLADKTEGLTEPDEIPDNVEPRACAGDVWRLGRHVLVCGDSTDADTVAKCLDGVTPNLMVTDPPYGVEYDAGWRKDRGLVDKTNGAALGKVLNDDQADWREAWSLFPGDIAYVWHAGMHAGEVMESLQACDFNIRAQIIWNKSSFTIGRGDYHWKHEPCWYAVRKNKPGEYVGGRKQSTVWDIDRPRKSESGHSTQKPVECMKRPIENNSSAGQAVYEPFCGSGTTLIAAEMTGRTCHAIELNPEYVDVAVKRWENFTGNKAVRDGEQE